MWSILEVFQKGRQEWLGLLFSPHPHTHRLEAMSECIGVVDGEQASMVKDKNLHNEKPQRLESQVSSFVSHSSFPPLPKASFSLLSPCGELQDTDLLSLFFTFGRVLAYKEATETGCFVLFCVWWGWCCCPGRHALPAQGKTSISSSHEFQTAVNNPVVKPIQLRLQPASLPNKIEEKYLSAL